MTPRMVMPMLSAMPTPIIMLMSERQRPIALRMGYGNRSRTSGAAGSLRTRTRAVSASAVLSICRAQTLQIQPPCFVDENAERLFACRGGVSVASGKTALDQVGQRVRERRERRHTQRRCKLANAQKSERDDSHHVRAHLGVQFGAHEIRRLHAAYELHSEKKTLRVHRRFLVAHVLAEDPRIDRIHGQQQWVSAERHDGVSVDRAERPTVWIGFEALEDIVQEPQAFADQDRLE